MTEIQFNILFAFHKNVAGARMALQSRMSESCLRENLDYLTSKGWLKSNSITAAGYDALAPYKVDNAIIMAAGMSSRCLPLSNIIPKGLFKIKRQILLEREIEQIKAAGIDKIILVVGYLKEKFYYLKEKHGVIIVENPEYKTKNNIHSLYLAQSYMKNSYICCSDNYFQENVFAEYVYDSYYACKYSDDYIDEFCLTRMDGNYIAGIARGGEKSWYTMGEAYFNAAFSKKFINLLNSEYGNADIHKMLMDDYHIRHIDKLKLRKKEYADDVVREFDTLKDFLDFDAEFFDFFAQFFPVHTKQINQSDAEPVSQWRTKYDAVKRYNAIPTEQKTGRLHLNENLFKPSPKCLETLKAITHEDVYLYDLAKEDALEIELSKYLNLPMENIFVHNGSAEVIKTILSIVLNKGDTILLPQPNWSYYKSVADVKFTTCEYYNVAAQGGGGGKPISP